MREAAYNKHLLPYWQRHKITGPSKEEFISGKYTPITDKTAPGFVTKTVMSAAESAMKVGETFQKAEEKVIGKLGKTFDIERMQVPTEQLHQWDKDYDQAFSNALNYGSFSSKDIAAARHITTEGWMSDNIHDSLKDNIAKSSGELLIQLPFFAAAGKAIGATGKIPTLAAVGEKILKMPGGPTILTAIKDATEGYLAARGTGYTHEESTEQAKSFAELGVAGKVGGKLVKAPASFLRRTLFSKVAQTAGPEVVKTAIAEAVAQEEGRKVFDPNSPFTSFTEATRDMLNQKAKDNKYINFRIAPKAIKIKILKELGYEASQAVSNPAAFTKKKVEQVVASELTETAKNSPVLAENLKNTSQVMKKWGVDPVKQTAQYISDKAEKEVGVKSKRAITKKISSSEEQVGVKIAPASKSVGAASSRDIRPLGRPMKPGARPLDRIALPEPLAGAKPKFGYGQSLFDISFEGNGLNKALYIVASQGSKAHQAYYDFIKNTTKWDDATIRQAAKEVKSHVKTVVKSYVDQGQKEGVVKIFRTFDPLSPTEHTKALRAGAEAKLFNTPEQLKAGLEKHPEAKDAVRSVDDKMKMIAESEKAALEKKTLKPLRAHDIGLRSVNVTSVAGNTLHINFDASSLKELAPEGDFAWVIANKLFPEMSNDIYLTRIGRRQVFVKGKGKYHLQIDFKTSEAVNKAVKQLTGK